MQHTSILYDVRCTPIPCGLYPERCFPEKPFPLIFWGKKGPYPEKSFPKKINHRKKFAL